MEERDSYRWYLLVRIISRLLVLIIVITYFPNLFKEKGSNLPLYYVKRINFTLHYTICIPITYMVQIYPFSIRIVQGGHPIPCSTDILMRWTPRSMPPQRGNSFYPSPVPSIRKSYIFFTICEMKAKAIQRKLMPRWSILTSNTLITIRRFCTLWTTKW